MSAALEIGLGQLALAGGLVLLAGLLSLALGLGVGKRLAVASVRTVVQLSILGAILAPLFRAELWWLVALATLAMIALAALESVRRAGRHYRGIRRDAFLSLLVAGGSTALLATTVIVRVEPWWDPRYLIPVLGMILGNGLTGISIGLDLCPEGTRRRSRARRGLARDGRDAARSRATRRPRGAARRASCRS